MFSEENNFPRTVFEARKTGADWPSGRSAEYQNGRCSRMAAGLCAAVTVFFCSLAYNRLLFHVQTDICRDGLAIGQCWQMQLRPHGDE